MRIRDWSSDVCSSDLLDKQNAKWMGVCAGIADYTGIDVLWVRIGAVLITLMGAFPWTVIAYFLAAWLAQPKPLGLYTSKEDEKFWQGVRSNPTRTTRDVRSKFRDRSEEHTSELQSLMRISYAVFCLKKKNKRTTQK